MPLPQISVDLQSAEQPSPAAVLPSSQSSPGSIVWLPHTSFLQDAEQPSPSRTLPSSHSSPESMIALPHGVTMQSCWLAAHAVPSGHENPRSPHSTEFG